MSLYHPNKICLDYWDNSYLYYKDYLEPWGGGTLESFLQWDGYSGLRELPKIAKICPKCPELLKKLIIV